MSTMSSASTGFEGVVAICQEINRLSLQFQENFSSAEKAQLRKFFTDNPTKTDLVLIVLNTITDDDGRLEYLKTFLLPGVKKPTVSTAPSSVLPSPPKVQQSSPSSTVQQSSLSSAPSSVLPSPPKVQQSSPSSTVQQSSLSSAPSSVLPSPPKVQQSSPSSTVQQSSLSSTVQQSSPSPTVQQSLCSSPSTNPLPSQSEVANSFNSFIKEPSHESSNNLYLPDSASQKLRYYEIWNCHYSKWPSLNEFSNYLQEVHNIVEKAQIRLLEMDNQLKFRQNEQKTKRASCQKLIKRSTRRESLKERIDIAKGSVILGGYNRINEHYDDFHNASSLLVKRNLIIDDSLEPDHKKTKKISQDSDHEKLEINRCQQQ
ncbi:hypothetical protein Glove_142g26 [Diversispora epigaea]|uniref:Uncharacterized protein n=1 Tax=Diversispora epigaea TaxID=1348612 RepID=A0A397IUJ8_9GLOM|nr:hypothetical protein Glove_142g26 [Diversispora epigaea]